MTYLPEQIKLTCEVELLENNPQFSLIHLLEEYQTHKKIPTFLST